MYILNKYIYMHIIYTWYIYNNDLFLINKQWCFSFLITTNYSIKLFFFFLNIFLYGYISDLYMKINKYKYSMQNKFGRLQLIMFDNIWKYKNEIINLCNIFKKTCYTLQKCCKILYKHLKIKMKLWFFNPYSKYCKAQLAAHFKTIALDAINIYVLHFSIYM